MLGLGRGGTVVFQSLARTTQLAAESRQLLVGAHTRFASRLGFSTQLIELPIESLESSVCLATFGTQSLELTTTRGGAGLGLVQFRAQIAQTGDEVLAFFLEQQQAGVQPLENGLHSSPLLGQVAYEQSLLLEQSLELLEFTVLFGKPVPRQLDICVGFLLLLREHVPLCLQALEIVHGKRCIDVAQLGDKIGVRGGLVGLPLERPQLAVDLG